MPFSNVPRGSLRPVRKRSFVLGPPPAAPPPGATPSGLWRGILVGLAITAAAVALGFLLAGCTIERVILYETVHYPQPGTTPSGAIYPQARTP